MKLDLPVEIYWSGDNREYVVTSPVFPGLSGLGVEQADAFEALHTAIQCWLDQLEARWE